MPLTPLHPDKLHAIRKLGQTYPGVKKNYKMIAKKKPAPAPIMPKKAGLIARIAFKLHHQRQEQERRG